MATLERKTTIIRKVLSEVNLDINDVIADELNVGRRAIIDAVAFLCNNSIICRTDIRGIFIVNHNLVFRGNIEQFYKTYTAFYHDKLVIVSNKVVLNK